LRHAGRNPRAHTHRAGGTVLASFGRVEEKSDSLAIEQMNNPFSH
jgi:hypothetical protein